MADADASHASNHDVTIAWLEDLAEGKSNAVEEFWMNYGDSLQRVAERQIASWLRRRVDPEDVVQSACRTFFRRAGAGDFSLENKDDLWKLLLTITLNKVRMQARFHSAQRRGALESASLEQDDAQHPGVSVEEAVEFADAFGKILSSLGSAEGDVIRLKLDGYSHAEIAEQLQCTERTVGRLLVKARAALGDMFGQSPGEFRH